LEKALATDDVAGFAREVTGVRGGVIDQIVRLAEGLQSQSELPLRHLRVTGGSLRVAAIVVEAVDAALTVSSLGVEGRQRLFGVGVDGREVDDSHASAGARFEATDAGRQGESPMLGRRAIQRVLVTTSWLQKLVRGICSGSNDGASARQADWE
jgi:hypothetical protein